MSSGSPWAEIKELTRVRVLLFLREPEVLFWVFAFPLILAAVLGYAFRDTGPQANKVGVVRGPGAEAIVQRLEKAELVEVKRVKLAKGLKKLQKGSIDVLVLPGSPPTLRVDTQRADGETGRLRVELALGMRERELKIEPVTETGSRYIDFLFPGLLGMNLMGTGMWMIGFSIAEQRQKKLLKRMMVTPMRRSSFLLSFMTSRLVFFALETAILVALAVWVLGVPFQANIVVFTLFALLGAAIFSGLGMLVTARVKTIQGASGMLNLVMMPMWLVTGVFFSYERFPDTLQPFLRVLPLSALNDGLRELMLDGEGIAAIGTETAILAAWGVGSFLIALRIFRWE